MLFADPLSNVSVHDDENRWLVVGLALNTVVVPQMRELVTSVIDKVYTHLKKTKGIHQQSHTGHLTRYPDNPPNTKLQYKNINSNASKDKARWDYDVQCSFDFAQLFRQPNMAKSKSLQEYDFTALADIIREVDDSPCSDLFKTVRKEADDVRKIRNTWAHAHFPEWDEAQYNKSFVEMKSLVSQLKVTPDVSNRELTHLKTNGKHRWDYCVLSCSFLS